MEEAGGKTSVQRTETPYKAGLSSKRVCGREAQFLSGARHVNEADRWGEALTRGGLCHGRLLPVVTTKAKEPAEVIVVQASIGRRTKSQHV